MAIVAIVGRPNVGKSTLFNRLVGKRLAIVDDTPGVTRDRREGDGSLAELRFRIFDTAGFEDATDDSLEARMRRQTERAIVDADVALLMVDARAGITPLDERFANLLRKGKTPIILIANKCEGRAAQSGLMESFSLGLGEPIAFSAEHGEGLSELYDALKPYVKDRAKSLPGLHMPDLDVDLDPDAEDAVEEERPEAGSPERPLQIAIVGRPNVGKSTLINRYLGEDRLLTGPEAGITRDSIAVDWVWKDKHLRMVDTAGLRKRARVSEKVERLSAADTRRTIDFAEVVVLVLDADDMLEKQDLTIARQVIEEGRALIIAANKWDAVENRLEQLQKLKDRLQTSLTQLKGVSVVTISALQGRNLDKLLAEAFRIHKIWNKRISTAKLNTWLEGMVAAHPPPLAKGRRIKIRYMTQVKIRPPTFAIFASQAENLPEAYIRYLTNGLRSDFGMDGVPLRLNLRQGKNPFQPQKR
ncbi:MAG TPA: ribosome biogenesis GTPase Der [Rhodospirillaceae bacterium]|nr:ribosome biogenesis GTPase Der [Rhodospirillaceae bacterium]MAX62996.1 ribosome biogenesis GTPase Der [Rhodospirillaceae bacterium]MBB57843.1 ribosome biogenesis GTPase Der [Rhodospirillaceae bacterium]HAE02425.1 ribosome biogenesis GTPase Der [Rhodospirillaceae bacterium]|tara:strand:+ start:58332 stop:59747 length:1416 start_codon:yes stop_codon:yes gene_type:complete